MIIASKLMFDTLRAAFVFYINLRHLHCVHPSVIWRDWKYPTGCERLLS